jgi:hypothetical protein
MDWGRIPFLKGFQQFVKPWRRDPGHGTSSFEEYYYSFANTPTT